MSFDTFADSPFDSEPFEILENPPRRGACARCHGKRSVPLGGRMIPCPLCCRKANGPSRDRHRGHRQLPAGYRMIPARHGLHGYLLVLPGQSDIDGILVTSKGEALAKARQHHRWSARKNPLTPYETDDVLTAAYGSMSLAQDKSSLGRKIEAAFMLGRASAYAQVAHELGSSVLSHGEPSGALDTGRLTSHRAKQLGIGAGMPGVRHFDSRRRKSNPPALEENPLTGREANYVLEQSLRALTVAQDPTAWPEERLRSAGKAGAYAKVVTNHGPAVMHPRARDLHGDAFSAAVATRLPRNGNPLPILLLGNTPKNPPGSRRGGLPLPHASPRASNPPQGVRNVSAAREHCKGFHDVDQVTWQHVRIPGSGPPRALSFTGLAERTSYVVPQKESNKHGPVWDHKHKLSKAPAECYDPESHTTLKILQKGTGPSDWWRETRGPKGRWQ